MGEKGEVVKIRRFRVGLRGDQLGQRFPIRGRLGMRESVRVLGVGVCVCVC